MFAYFSSTHNGIDINTILANSNENWYDDLMDRIELIQTSYKHQSNQLKQMTEINLNKEFKVQITHKIHRY